MFVQVHVYFQLVTQQYLYITDMYSTRAGWRAVFYLFIFLLPVFGGWYYIIDATQISTPRFSRETFYLLILQAVGIIAAVGDSVKNLKVGTPAALMTFGSYAEFTMVHYLEIYRFYNDKRSCIFFLFRFPVPTLMFTEIDLGL